MALKPQEAKPTASSRRQATEVFREPPEGKKLFHGFLAKMIYKRQANKQENQPPINIETDVKFANASLQDEIPEIIMRDSKGREVVRVPDTKYHYIYCVKGTEPGNDSNLPAEIVPESEIKHFQVIKGNEVEVGKFERTKNIVVDRFMPKTELDLWQIDNTYEVWADHTHGLYEVAKDLEARDEVGISKVSFGGFKESYALISSVREGDKFVVTMSLSQKRKKYYHSMPFADTSGNDFKQEDNKVQGLLEEI